MKVYLLLVNDEEFFFYSDGSEADEWRDDDPPVPPGIRSRLRERWHELQRSIREADAGAARWVRVCWNWLHSRARPDEEMLARLRSTRRIDLYHPSSRDPSTVNTIWRTYLGQRYRRHLTYALINSAIALPTILFLWPLPGPNIIGYWFVYRAIHHLMIVLGISRVHGGSVPTMLHTMMSLNLPVVTNIDDAIKQMAFKGKGKATE